MLSRMSLRWKWYDWLFVAVVVIVHCRRHSRGRAEFGSVAGVASGLSCPGRWPAVDCQRPVSSGAAPGSIVAEPHTTSTDPNMVRLSPLLLENVQREPRARESSPLVSSIPYARLPGHKRSTL